MNGQISWKTNYQNLLMKKHIIWIAWYLLQQLNLFKNFHNENPRLRWLCRRTAPPRHPCYPAVSTEATEPRLDWSLVLVECSVIFPDTWEHRQWWNAVTFVSHPWSYRRLQMRQFLNYFRPTNSETVQFAFFRVYLQSIKSWVFHNRVTSHPEEQLAPPV